MGKVLHVREPLLIGIIYYYTEASIIYYYTKANITLEL